MKYSELIRCKKESKRIGAMFVDLLDGCNIDTFESSRMATAGKFADRIRRCIAKQKNDRYDGFTSGRYWLYPIFSILYCGEQLNFVSNGIAHSTDPLVRGLDPAETDGHSNGFCTHPLCPICSKLKSDRIYARMRYNLDSYIDWSAYPDGVSFVFFTFSPPLMRRGCNFGEYFQAQRAAIQYIDRYYTHDCKNGPCIGVFGNGEYTFSTAIGFQDWSHPHFHCIFAFDNRYFKNPRFSKMGRLTSFEINRNGSWELSCTKFIADMFQHKVLERLSTEDKFNLSQVLGDWQYKAEYLGSDIDRLREALPELCKYTAKFTSINTSDQLLVALQSMYGRHVRIGSGIFKIGKEFEYSFKQYLNDVGDHYQNCETLTAEQIELIENSTWEDLPSNYQYIWRGLFDPVTFSYNLCMIDKIRLKE